MGPRKERWDGSLGLWWPGPGDHWKEHHGITRAVTEEGQQRFRSERDALRWIREGNGIPFVYRDDGLVVGWGKTLERRQLQVEVWQVFIQGRKPRRLPGSRNRAIKVDRVPVDPGPLWSAVRRGDLGAVRRLLAQKADPNLRNAAGAPLLVLAAE